MKTKICSNCGLDKLVSEFSKKASAADGYSYKCKDCQNKYNREHWYPKNKDKQRTASRLYKERNKLKIRAKQYNVNEDFLRIKVAVAGGKCEICGKEARLNIDHDHSTGKYRGLLCANCNWGLGMFEDDIERLKRAIKYLSL